MYFKNFVVFGISHKNLSLEERESFVLKNISSKIEELFQEGKIRGYVNLSTCLRIEYYLDLDKNFPIEKLKESLKVENIFIKHGHDAVNYLFRVTCGFESVIKGEDQILAQIKKAQLISMETKVSSSNINVIFNKAIELGKKFRNKSKISHNALSLEAISLKFMKSKLGTLRDKKILILGVGDLAKDIMGLLKKEEYKSLTITNRSQHKALEVQDIYNAEVVSFENKLEEVGRSNIIISATSAPHIVIKKSDFLEHMDKDKKYIFLDLAVPRDIEQGIEDLPNVELYNIDDVWGVYYENLENRENLLSEFEYMLGDQMLNLRKWFEYKEGIA